jgi:hypothetical protein
MFKSFEHRGEVFKKAVNEMRKAERGMRNESLAVGNERSGV